MEQRVVNTTLNSDDVTLRTPKVSLGTKDI